MIKVQEVKLSYLEHQFQLASYTFSGEHCSPVNKGKYHYSIRVLGGQNINYNSGTTSTKWDYFETTKEGLITKSPRGYAKEYNKKIRITDLDKRIEEYEKDRS